MRLRVKLILLSVLLGLAWGAPRVVATAVLPILPDDHSYGLTVLNYPRNMAMNICYLSEMAQTRSMCKLMRKRFPQGTERSVVREQLGSSNFMRLESTNEHFVSNQSGSEVGFQFADGRLRWIMPELNYATWDDYKKEFE